MRQETRKMQPKRGNKQERQKNNWENALKILSRSSQSKAMLEEKLKRRGSAPEEIQKISKKAAHYGFINDKAHAQYIIEKGMGQGKNNLWIAAKLIAHGIEKSLVRDLLSEDKVIEYLENIDD